MKSFIGENFNKICIVIGVVCLLTSFAIHHFRDNLNGAFLGIVCPELN